MLEVALTLEKAVRDVWPSKPRCWGGCIPQSRLAAGRAASGTLESTGDFPSEAVIPAEMPRWVQLAKVPREEWSCCSDSWCHSMSSWCPPGWGCHR